MGFKIWCQLVKLTYNFQITLCTCVYFHNNTKVFQTHVYGWDRVSKVSFNFFILGGFMDYVYIYLYMESKIVTNIPMVFEIWCQVGELGYYFQNYSMYLSFLLFILKVRCFKHTSCHRPFFNLMSSWRAGVWFLIQTHWRSQAFFSLQSDNSLVLHIQCPSLTRSSLYLSLRGPAQYLHGKREAQVYG